MKFLGLFVPYGLGQICTKFESNYWGPILSTNQMPQDEGMQKTNTQAQRDAGIWWAGLSEEETAALRKCLSSQVEQGVGLLDRAEFRRHVDRVSVGKQSSAIISRRRKLR